MKTVSLNSLFLTLLIISLPAATSAQSSKEAKAWRSGLGLMYTSVNVDISPDAFGAGFGFQTTTNTTMMDTRLSPVTTFGFQLGYAGLSADDSGGILFARPHLGGGVSYRALENDDLVLIPRLMLGTDGTAVLFTDGEEADGGLNIYLSPGIGVRFGELSVALEARFSMGSILAFSSDDTVLGEATRFPGNTGRLTISYTRMQIILETWSRTTTLGADASIAGIEGLDLFRYNGFNLGFGVALGR